MGFYQNQKYENMVINDTIESIPYKSHKQKFEIIDRLKRMQETTDPTIREIEADDRGFIIFIHNINTTVNFPKHILRPH
jgi:hypothetical protein